MTILIRYDFDNFYYRIGFEETNNIRIETGPDKRYELIRKIAARMCHVPEEEITGIDYLKRSLDSRNKKNRFSLSLEVYSGEQIPIKDTIKSKYKDADQNKRVIIIGAGPAGYFAALELLEYGIKPIVLERGKDVRARRRDVREIMQKGFVNPDSNYCFGEGGAGAYSDGKLYTRSDKRGKTKKALNIFVEHGAQSDILIDAHPHIGSNKLPGIISAIRETILSHGGEVHFNSLVTDIIIKDNITSGVIVNNEKEFTGFAVLLATGHSARDIYYLFDKKKLYIEAKPFAVGLRVEHYQELINIIQYGNSYPQELPPASYRLAAQVGQSGVFSFCMCPGGIIVPASTAPRELVVNGMSMSGRNSKFANSGIVTSVGEREYEKFLKHGALAGLRFQESLEHAFYTDNSENLMKAPAQRLLDFTYNKKTTSLMESSYIPGLIISELNRLFPRKITTNLQSGLREFGDKMKGFLTQDANVIGLESRTSSPVRILRDKELLHHTEIKNLFPCGEGAGYAGGIISAAMDGQNCARAIAEQCFRL
jgi:uncharacterized protein